MTQTNIVAVQYKNRHGEGYGGRAYSYIADRALEVGDVVTVPTKFGDTEARVCRIDVPEEEVAAFRAMLRHITEAPKAAVPGSDPFADFFS